jgi:allose kinase
LRTENLLQDLSDYLKSYFEMLCEQDLQAKAIAIGFPATLDRGRKTVLQAPNVPFMEHLPVVDVLTEQLGVPVIIERDVCLALYYDQAKYRIPDCEVLTGCYFGTGVGNAILINGVPLLGHNGTAGELGHIAVVGDHELCGCGNKGCMENLAGGKYLARLCREQEEYHETPVGELFAQHGSDPLLLQFVECIAITVAAELNILNPDYMCIGGGVIAMKDFPLDYLKDQIYQHARKPYPAEDLNLIFTEDEQDKCVVGAALYAVQKLGL